MNGIFGSAEDVTNKLLFNVAELPEWGLLSGEDVMATPEATGGQVDLEAEKKRTQCSLNCLRYLYEGGDNNFAALTVVQDESVRLTRDQFEELHQWFGETLADDESYQMMQYIMTIHDMGKSGRVYETMGVDQKRVDHDEILTMLLETPDYCDQRELLLPTFSTLTDQQQQLIKDVFKVRLSFGQFLQAEAPAAAIAGLPEDLDEKTRNMYVMHALLDIAGVVGHVNPDSSAILTAPTYMSMARANMALTDKELTSPVERYDAYLAYRADQLGIKTEGLDEQGSAEAKAQVRLGCMLRYASPEQMAELHEAFTGLLLPVKAILTTELNRNGITDRATLPYYGPALLKVLSEKHGIATALNYFAHIMQEAHIADTAARAKGETGVLTADLGDLARAFNQLTAGVYENFGRAVLKSENYLDPAHTTVRFERHGEMLQPQIEPVLKTLDGLGLRGFDGETDLKGKRILFVGMGGGSDSLQAAMLGKLFNEKYSSQTAAVVSVRGGDKPLINAGQLISSSTVEITPQTKPGSNWRFLESIPLESDEAPPMFMLNSLDQATIQYDLRELAKKFGAEVIIGVDTGGDSLYRADTSSTEAVTTSPDQDHIVLKALAGLENVDGIGRAYSVVVAPGIDSPDYAEEVLIATEAARITLDQHEAGTVERTYTAWRMDGSASEEGRYGKTPLAWLKALQGTRGLTALELPAANAVSSTNPWRIFLDVTPAMAEIVVMDAGKHAALASTSG